MESAGARNHRVLLCGLDLWFTCTRRRQFREYPIPRWQYVWVFGSVPCCGAMAHGFSGIAIVDCPEQPHPHHRRILPELPALPRRLSPGTSPRHELRLLQCKRRLATCAWIVRWSVRESRVAEESFVYRLVCRHWYRALSSEPGGLVIAVVLQQSVGRYGTSIRAFHGTY